MPVTRAHPGRAITLVVSVAISSAALSLTAAAVTRTPGPPPPSTCAIVPDKAVPIAPAPGRVVYCGLDIGSRTVKLSVDSMVPGRRASIRDERLCSRTLGMGAQVFDSKTGTAGPLPPAGTANLADTIKEYQGICRRDHGTMMSAGATQWARDATNIAEVRRQVRAATGLAFDVLSPAQEAEFGYIAASVNTPGRIVIDPGSNSFEIAWQPKGSHQIRTVVVDYGYVRGAANDFEPARTYQAGLAAYQAKVTAKLTAALAGLSPPVDLATLARLVRTGKIGPELVALGQDGAVQSVVRGSLRTNGTWVADPKVFASRLARPALVVDPAFGVMTDRPLERSELRGFIASISAADFKTLTTEPVRSLYGQKALAVPALVDMLMREFGLNRLVVVPQEMTTGQILSALSKSR